MKSNPLTHHFIYSLLMRLQHYILNYSTNNKPINKANYQAIRKHHSKTSKLKYDYYMNKLNLKHIKLDYHTHYNWLYELYRINKFDRWPLFNENIDTPRLGLPNRNLSQIPKEICKFVNVRDINFCENFLKHLPIEIMYLDKITAIYIGNNSLKYFPKQLTKLTNLQILSMRCNELEYIPREI